MIQIVYLITNLTWYLIKKEDMLVRFMTKYAIFTIIIRQSNKTKANNLSMLITYDKIEVVS